MQGRREFLKWFATFMGSLSLGWAGEVFAARPVAMPRSVGAPRLKLRTSSDLDALYDGLDLFWGDIHGHTAYSDGYGTPDEYYYNARYMQKLDFTAVTDHAEWMDRYARNFPMENGAPIPFWDLSIEAADRNCVDGGFTTLPAYEWTSTMYGHRSVYFRDTANIPSKPFGTDDYPTPDNLWDALSGYPAITISHHPMREMIPTDWSYYNQMERLVEIYSKWGNSEDPRTIDEQYLYLRASPEKKGKAEGHSVNDMLRLGYRIGIIAGSDSHQGLAGSIRMDKFRGIPVKDNRDAALSSRDYSSEIIVSADITGEEFLEYVGQGYRYDYREPKGGGGGLTGLWAAGLRRDMIWDRMFARTTYATTGPRVELRFAVRDSMARAGAIMGGELVVAGNPVVILSAKAEAGSHIHEVIFMKNGEPIARFIEDKPEVELEFEDKGFLKGRTAYYQARVVIRQEVGGNTDGDKVLKQYGSKNKFYESDDPMFKEITWTSPVWVD
ncbi:MAG: DUF3604 domain-containing protein [Deltaproteobacteria bacterium]|nr:DUF3604 domain-containing protein [Deltaproteobacteria bacterium]